MLRLSSTSARCRLDERKEGVVDIWNAYTQGLLLQFELSYVSAKQLSEPLCAMSSSHVQVSCRESLKSASVIECQFEAHAIEKGPAYEPSPHLTTPYTISAPQPQPSASTTRHHKMSPLSGTDTPVLSKKPMLCMSTYHVQRARNPLPTINQSQPHNWHNIPVQLTRQRPGLVEHVKCPSTTHTG